MDGKFPPDPPGKTIKKRRAALLQGMNSRSDGVLGMDGQRYRIVSGMHPAEPEIARQIGIYKSRLSLPLIRHVADFLMYKVLWPFSSGAYYVIPKDEMSPLWHRPVQGPE